MHDWENWPRITRKTCGPQPAGARRRRARIGVVAAPRRCPTSTASRRLASARPALAPKCSYYFVTDPHRSRFGPMEQKPLTTLPGTRDILPVEIPRWHLVEDRARQVLALYGFQEIRTPLLEATELFARGIGGDTDIVGKEMYTFTDQGG